MMKRIYMCVWVASVALIAGCSGSVEIDATTSRLTEGTEITTLFAGKLQGQETVILAYARPDRHDMLIELWSFNASRRFVIDRDISMRQLAREIHDGLALISEDVTCGADGVSLISEDVTCGADGVSLISEDVTCGFELVATRAELAELGVVAEEGFGYFRLAVVAEEGFGY